METHVLGIKADGSWTYRLGGQSHAAATGTWVHEQGESDGSAVVISFKVEAPAALLEGTPFARPGFVFGSISRDCLGRLSVCFGTESQICYRRQSETGEKGTARRTPDRPHPSDARASFRLTPPASCLL